MAAAKVRIYVEPRMPGWWDRLVIAFSVAAILLLLVDFRLGSEGPAADWIGWIDSGLCAFFLIDFAARLQRAEWRWQFVRRNWVDLLGSIPLVGPLRVARAVRLMRLVRLLRIAVLVRRILIRNGIVVPRSLRYIFLIATAIWLAAASLFYAFEASRNDNVKGFDDALWWSMTTLSTVGYGDLYPTTTGGRVVAVVTMVLGVGVLGTLAGALATGFIDARDRARRGVRTYAMHNHLLVLGWNDSAPAVVHEFLADPRHTETAVIVVAEREVSPLDEPTVRFVRGEPMRRSVLERAAARHAAAAIVMANRPGDAASDLYSALVVSSLRRLNPNLRVSAQVVDPANREVLEDAGCDALVSSSAVLSAMLVRGVQDLRALDVVHDLISSRGGSQIYRVSVPARLVGQRFRDYALALIDQRATPVALVRGREILTNPDPQLRIEAGDDAFVIGSAPPVLG